ncbi:nucleotide-binding universal stress UspA family protein [Kribbella orskensis]|uniref:Nucleotide-binding universal stress UspA family protein n=1 Tax=Kribbella orskensis TaxID=2512216 RepID=A0ABY2BA76_9ACTN|nr:MULTISPECIES: universal stress protein [Kribbella]TCN32913.1 nucleotide-binding universal stress UspA family protein [Kribbella sp. VKM Ac-2500]TCO13213.1 nucleotide-binding universal stress UspA family protein [Kribbella orskensis]
MTKTYAVDNCGRPPVVVGVDGSISAQAALAWAAAEAWSRRCPLRIIHTFSWPMVRNALDMTLVGDMNNALQSAAEWVLAEAEAHARHVAPGLRVGGELFVGGAAPTLLSQAQGAALVVVGSRGLGGFRGLLVGSVSAAVAAHAPCPVIVVHPHRDGTAFPTVPTGRVVVGVDGSEVSTAAIRFAFQEAARRRIGVTAVHAATATRQHPSFAVPADIVEQVEQQLFAESMESKRVLFPGIDLEVKLVHSHPAQALIDESDGAELVVVGSHGRGGFTGMLLGSVSQAVLHHAACPVAVVHPLRTKSLKPLPARRRSLQIAAPSHLAELKERS